MLHALKTTPNYFKDIVSGEKTFEVRAADRPFTKGDAIVLQEYLQETKTYTGEEWEGTITYILSDPAYVKKGFCVLGIKPKAE